MARDFAGADRYLYHSTACVTAAPISISCWFTVADAAADGDRTLVAIADQASDTNFFSLRRVTGGTDYLYWSTRGTGTGTAFMGATYTANTWYHALGVEITSTSRYVYLGGSQSPENTSLQTPAGLDNTTMGFLRRVAGGFYHNGLIAEVGVWNAALSQAEANILAAGFAPPFVRPGNLIGYWPLTGNNDPETDIVGNYNMTLGNTPLKAAHSPIIYPAPLWIPSKPGVLEDVAASINISPSANYVQIV